LFRENYDGPRFPYQGKSRSSAWNATWIPNPYPPGTVSQEKFRAKVAEEFVDVISGRDKRLYKKLFSGLYGTGFLIDQSLQLVPMLRQSTYPRKTIDHQPADPKEKMLMKVQLLDSREREEEAFQEDATLEAVSNGVARYHGLEIRGSTFVPRFIFGCTMPYTPTNKDNVTMYFRLTFMTYIEGKTLYEYLKSNKITPLFYARLEKAFTALWMMGYAHNDAHLWNIMVETATKKPYIIDFGMSRKLNRSRHDLFIENLSVLASNNAFNKHFLDPMASEMFYDRNLPFMNVDSRLLRSLRRGLNPCAVARARQKVWELPTNNKNPISERLDAEREAACTRN
jgi:hypothetical protein